MNLLEKYFRKDDPKAGFVFGALAKVGIEMAAIDAAVAAKDDSFLLTAINDAIAKGIQEANDKAKAQTDGVAERLKVIDGGLAEAGLPTVAELEKDKGAFKTAVETKISRGVAAASAARGILAVDQNSKNTEATQISTLLVAYSKEPDATKRAEIYAQIRELQSAKK